MSCGGIISDRALYDKKFYQELRDPHYEGEEGFPFRHWSGEDVEIVFYQNEKKGINITGHKFGLMMVPIENTTKYLCDGNNRHAVFFTEAERACFYEKMKSFAKECGIVIVKETQLPFNH